MGGPPMHRYPASAGQLAELDAMIARAEAACGRYRQAKSSEKRDQLDAFCHRAVCAKGLLNGGGVLASVRDPWRRCAATLT